MDDPVALDKHRGMAAQRATEIRRQLAHVAADQEGLRRRQAELERLIFAAPAQTWHDAAAKARYLIGLYAQTLEARDPRRQQLIASAIDDLAKLDGELPAAPGTADP
jgi:hypothetical protein